MTTSYVAGARFVRSSDQSLLVYFDRPDESWPRDQPQSGTTLVEANENVRRLLQLLHSQRIAGVRNLHPAYCSLLVKFDALQWRHEEMEEKLRDYLQHLHEVRLQGAVRGMQIAHARNRFRLQQPQQLHHLLMGIEGDF
jgi:hypothetical protein